LLSIPPRHTRTRGADFAIRQPGIAKSGRPAINHVRADLPRRHLRPASHPLAKIDARLAECVDLKFFCGFSFNEIAQLRDVSERTVQRDWDKARLLLNRFINDQEDQWQSA
jgi:DNA-directed RNA polymerase specialized sigma24 family protein